MEAFSLGNQGINIDRLRIRDVRILQQEHQPALKERFRLKRILWHQLVSLVMYGSSFHGPMMFGCLTTH